jgi:hypothetical protein
MRENIEENPNSSKPMIYTKDILKKHKKNGLISIFYPPTWWPSVAMAAPKFSNFLYTYICVQG